MSKLETNTIDTISGSTTLTLGGTNATTIAQDSATTVTGFKSTGIDDNATSTAITIDSSENIGVGTSSPDQKLEVVGTLKVTNTSNASNNSNIRDGGGLVIEAGNSNPMYFYTGGGEKVRLNNLGDITLGTTTGATQPGLGNSSTGISLRGVAANQFFISSASTPMFVNRTIDGSLMIFQSAGNTEGSITISGSTTYYNGFTGTHWSRLANNSTPNILKGTVLETLDEMCDWYNLEFDITNEDGNTYTKRVPHVLEDGESNGDVITYNHEGTDYQATITKEADIKHMKSKVSDTVDAKNVYGVFSSYDNDGDGYNDFYVASVGSFVVRIKANETIAKGDLLQSNGDGTAKVQTDDNVKSSSFAKVLSTTIIETYEDGSFIVPCSLMC